MPDNDAAAIHVAGTWTIVHEHNSVPMKMDGSGLAAVDLKPETGQPHG